MTVLVAIFVFVIKLGLGAPLPFPQDVPTTTTSAEAELASLFPILQSFLSTFVVNDPTQTVSLLASTPTETGQSPPPPISTLATYVQTTSEVVATSTTTFSSFETQQTQSFSTAIFSGANGNLQTDVNHGPVTFGELTTPSEGGTFNKFVENQDDGKGSNTSVTVTSTRRVHPPSTTSSPRTTSTFAANTLTSYTFFTPANSAHSIPTNTHTLITFPTHTSSSFSSPSVPQASAVSHSRSITSHGKLVMKRLFPSLFKDNENFDRFDVPGFSNSKSGNQASGQFFPANVVPPKASLFGSPGEGNGENSENHGNDDLDKNLGNEGSNDSGENGSRNQRNGNGQSSVNSNGRKNNNAFNNQNESSSDSTSTDNSVFQPNSDTNTSPPFPEVSVAPSGSVFPPPLNGFSPGPPPESPAPPSKGPFLPPGSPPSPGFPSGLKKREGIMQVGLLPIF